MMRSITIALIVFISSVYSFTSQAQTANDLSKQKLSGKVKSVTETSYRVKKVNGKQQSVFNAKSSSSYNTTGNKTNEYTYSNEGGLDNSSVLTYDANGLLEQEDNYNADGSPGFTNVYKYDKRGNIISTKLYDAFGSLFLKTSSSYDSRDNETEEVNYTQVVEKDKHKDVVLNRTTWLYDEKGNMVEEQYFDGDSSVTRKTVNKYDNGNKIEQKKSESGTTLKTTYKYDARGNVIEEIQYDADGNIAARITSGYDDKGNEAEELYYDKDNNLQTHTVFKITYDKNGNWTRREQLDNDKTIMVTVREIAYY